MAATAEISRPLYIVGMGRDASKLEKASDNGYDAFSWYGVPATKKAMSYQELTTAANQILNSLSFVAKRVVYRSFLPLLRVEIHGRELKPGFHG